MSLVQQMFIVCGALFAFFGVAAGAFGAHLLKTRLSADMLQVLDTAVRYQMIHALALIALVPLLPIVQSSWMTFAGGFFIVGTILFSGSLYLLILSGSRYWGAVTPVGGTLMLLGWLSTLLGSLFGRH